MSDPISIATLSILGAISVYKLIKILIKIKNKTIISTCCGGTMVDLHQSNHLGETTDSLEK